MTVREAVDALVRKLQAFDRTELLAGVPKLAEQDMTWHHRSRELEARVRLIVADGPTQELLDAVGAHVIAYKQALAEAEETRVDSGEEAAA